MYLSHPRSANRIASHKYYLYSVGEDNWAKLPVLSGSCGTGCADPVAHSSTLTPNWWEPFLVSWFRLLGSKLSHGGLTRTRPPKQRHDARGEDLCILSIRQERYSLRITPFDHSGMSTAIRLITMRVLRRTRAIIWRVRSGDAPPKTPAMRPSLAASLPQELVEMIITYLIYDMRSLRACSLTCYSWYIAAVPHLHRVLLAYVTNTGGQRFRWPDPIQPIYTLGLHPLVKDLRIFGDSDMGSWVTPKLIDRCILSQFKAFVNVRELRIGHLDIPSFMPRIRRYFGHFLPTVQSLTLGSPQGSHRQIIFFIGLFQHLDDLMLHDIKLSSWQVEPVNDVTLIPRFSPPLRGRLVA